MWPIERTLFYVPSISQGISRQSAMLMVSSYLTLLSFSVIKLSYCNITVKECAQTVNKLHRAWHMSVRKCISESYTFHCFTVSWYPIKSIKVFTKFKFNVRFELKEISLDLVRTNCQAQKNLRRRDYSFHTLLTLPTV